MLKTEAVGRGFQHLPRDLANVNVLEKMFDRCYCINSTIYLLKFGKLYGTILFHRLAVSERVHIFLNIRLPGPSASRDSRWLPSFDSTSIYNLKMTVHGGGCTTLVMQNEIQIHQQKRRKAYLYRQ